MPHQENEETIESILGNMEDFIRRHQEPAPFLIQFDAFAILEQDDKIRQYEYWELMCIFKLTLNFNINSASEAYDFFINTKYINLFDIKNNGNSVFNKNAKLILKTFQSGYWA